jgi:endo-1,4-beta-xylanase
MKEKMTLSTIAIFIAVCLATACKKNSGSSGGTNPPVTVDSTGTLKEAAAFPVGIGIQYNLMKNNATYAATIKKEFDNVTFGYEMKHGAIVKNDGSLDYTRADELMSIVQGAGLEVYGHTLAWHQNNNGNYLRSLAVSSNGTGTNLLTNGDFETGGATGFTGWSRLVGGTAAATFDISTTDVAEGTRAFKVIVATPGANAYDVQAINTTSWAAEIGKSYLVKFNAKSVGANGSLRMVNQNTSYQQADFNVTTTWTEYTWNLTALEVAPQIRLNFPAAGTYLVDNIRVTEAAVTQLPVAEVAKRVDTALKTFITGMVNHYKTTIKAWDVVNECMADGNSGLRVNPTPGTTTNDAFYWSEYLGRDYIAKAFQYANAADPAAILFLNDYNLESNSAKLDSTVNLINELKAKGVPVHGVGVQMHASINNNVSGVDAAFQKLAATGLKIKVTEMDVRVNPSNTAGFTPTQSVLEQQAAFYKYVVESYLRNVPAAQRYGITVWDLTDQESWIVTVQNQVDFPTLFDKDFKKKPAYYACLLALKKSQ